MSISPAAATYEAPIIGTADNDFINIEDSISFQWIPDSGNAYVGSFSTPDWETGDWTTTNTTGPSSAGGYVEFAGVTSSEPFNAVPAEVDFGFTDGQSVSLSWQLPYIGNAAWNYDPTTGVLDPNGMNLSWDNWIGVGFGVNETDFGTSHWSGSTSDTEYGHWQLVPEIHNVNVFGGDGNDTIFGGQGTEMLFGGNGNDLIRASVGNDVILGGAGDDEIHGGIGQQTLMGGAGNDKIWAGSGAQIVLGDEGQDVIHGGAGTQTLIGGAGNDTIWGGVGTQFLQGWEGNDTLHAGSGSQTLSGGTGRDTFIFSTADGQDVITDFQRRQDIIEIASNFGGLKLTRAHDLLQYVSADQHGDAVLAVGGNFRLVLQHVATQQIQTHVDEFFRLS